MTCAALVASAALSAFALGLLAGVLAMIYAYARATRYMDEGDEL